MKEDLKKTQVQTDGLEKRFDAFCKQVIRNSIKEVLRKERRRQFLENPAFELYIEDFTVGDDLESRNRGPCIGIYEAGDITLEVRDERLDEILKKLSKRKREVFILGYGFNYSNAEIAETLGISREAAKSTKTKAVRDIRNMLAEAS